MNGFKPVTEQAPGGFAYDYGTAQCEPYDDPGATPLTLDLVRNQAEVCVGEACFSGSFGTVVDPQTGAIEILFNGKDESPSPPTPRCHSSSR